MRQQVTAVMGPPPPPVPTERELKLEDPNDMKKELLMLRQKLEVLVKQEQEKRSPWPLSSAREAASKKEIAEEILHSALVLEKVHAAAVKHATEMVELEMAPLSKIL